MCRKIWNLILSPFNINLPFFTVLLFLSSFVDVVAWVIYGNPVFACYIGLHGYVMCYGLAILSYLLRDTKLKTLYEYVLIILGIVNAAIDLFCHCILQMGFTYDMVGIIKATNRQEVREFVSMFIDWKPVVLFLALVGLCLVLYKIVMKVRLNHKIQAAGFIIVLLTMVVTFSKHSTNWGRVFLGKPYLYMSYQVPPNLRQYYSNFEIYVDNDRLPRNIVLVIGESFSKEHSSLYGYAKNTNPLLMSLQKDSLLYVYKDAISPGTHTIAAFQNFMSTYNNEHQQEWYECPTLIEILDKAGYQTSWVSNQSQKGGYDNVAARYAELCDTSLWVGNRFEGTNRKSYDEEILPLLSSIVSNACGKNFYCVHLMGSHYTFDMRYPSDKWSYFHEADYIDYPAHQRYTLSTYDNSVLYNDYVVMEIIKLFKEEDTILIYLSDHSLDIYQSSNDYVGHATGNPKSKEVSTQIPYMIYCSSRFKELHAENIELIESSVDKHINSSDLIYSIMNILGIKASIDF